MSLSLSRSDLPPLAALRVFAAFVRLGSVRAAAEALSLTDGAVTYQLHAIEAFAGTRLLVRRGRALQLTEEGRVYGYRIRQALDDIADATQALVRPGTGSANQRPLRVALLPSFAHGWLLPRLAAFARECPDIALTLEAGVAMVDLEAARVDCAIRFGQGRWPGVVTSPLMGDRLLLVAAARHVAGGPQADLGRLRRLHSSENWGAWAASAGVGGIVGSVPDPAQMPWSFNDSSHQLEAARLGLGVALTRRSIADALLGQGQLVRAHPHEMDHPGAYYFLQPVARGRNSAVADFADWLQRTCADHAREIGLPTPA
jgi:LysR family glycine cleavage system transcriptional activator